MTDISEILFAQAAPAPQPEPAAAPLAEFADDMGDALDVDALLAVEKLSPREVRFLTEYIEHGRIARAAKAAGYPGGNPIKSSKALRVAVVSVQRSLATKFKYDATAAFKDLDGAMQFARDTGSAMALVRAIELKTKVAGHLDQKVSGKIQHDHTHEILDSRTDAELRAHAERLGRELGLHKPDAIDAEFTEIKGNE
ncbi:MAG: hypothetical protein NUV34_07480 [Sulfuricaulis sp.]|nr:hypothetical protein [Sulfuricaulis sp.]